MKNKLILTLIVSMFLISLISANQIASLGTFKQNECIDLKQSCADCSYINFTRVSYPDGTRAMNNTVATKDGSVFNLEFCNTDQLGTYIVEGIGDVEGTDTVFAYDFEVTTSGKSLSGLSVTANVLLFFFFALIIFTFYFTTKKIDYERWHNSILKRYENRNIVRVIISSIGYNVLKNKFIWYYLFGLPLMLIITDISYTFGVSSMIDLMKILLAIYWYGFLLVGIFFFGYLQEWVMQIIDEIKSMDYGV
jgi:hypothetical protein